MGATMETITPDRFAQGVPVAHFRRPSRPRVRIPIDVQQMRRIDGGVDLRRTEARMPQQLLQRAQVGAAAQQMRREAVAQRMRRRPLAKPQPGPRRAHRSPDHPRRQRPALHAAEQRLVRRGRPGHLRRIGLHRGAHLRQQWHDPRLVALARHRQRLPQRQHARRQRDRLADAQPCAIQQQQHRPIARPHPGFRRLVRHLAGQRHHLVRRDRPRHAGFDAGAAQPRHRRIGRHERQEPPHRRQFARGRGVAQPFATPRRQKGAQVRRAYPCQRRRRRPLAPMRLQERDQPLRTGAIGAHGMRRPTPVARQMRRPLHR
ncbi:hypothetical protein WR25_06092 [Diploscapter pachys]|uniref:Uncharacterized protein n=1 Tax=Diploscapter pachys TaxID=2018661 RepID=A0A2A2K6B2_9BILA|nr:hypothetical protein WR25_06092 [Diploscapter pachys]